MKLRTIYLQRLLSVNGRHAIGGRVLHDRFKELSDEILLGHIVYHDADFAKIKDPEIRADVISRETLIEFQPNVIFLEGGLFADSAGTWKVPEDIATQVCESGGVFIVADVDSNELRNRKELYRKAGPFFKAFASYGDSDIQDPVYGSDEVHFWRGYRQILCDPAKMVLADWIRPIYEDIPQILVGLPNRLALWESIVASCNSDTTATLQLDNWVDHQDACPFAAAAQVGKGFCVLIAGLVSGDAWLEGCQHNPRWLTNLATFLAKEASFNRRRLVSHWRSPHLLFLSHRSIDRPVVAAIAAAVKDGGVGVWLDEERLIPSQSLVSEINRALGKMTHFVLFWSSHCVGAPWVERELSSATALLLEKGVPLIIARLDDTPVPPIVADLVRIDALGKNPSAIGALIVDAVERLARRGA